MPGGPDLRCGGFGMDGCLRYDRSCRTPWWIRLASVCFSQGWAGSGPWVVKGPRHGFGGAEGTLQVNGVAMAWVGVR